MLSFSFSSFLFEENFKILKWIIMLKRNVRLNKILIITIFHVLIITFFYVKFDCDVSKTAKKKIKINKII